VEIARAQAVLVLDGRIDEIAPLAAEWRRLQETLPAIPSVEARPLLAEAAQIIRTTTASLQAAVSGAGDEIERLQHGRRAVAGVAGENTSALEIVA
jgi:hypothetical protein